MTRKPAPPVPLTAPAAPPPAASEPDVKVELSAEQDFENARVRHYACKVRMSDELLAGSDIDQRRRFIRAALAVIERELLRSWQDGDGAVNIRATLTCRDPEHAHG